MPKITALELENFQTIEARTVIPIRDLTLVFGPNGAGKSAVFDAINLMQRVTGSDWGKNAEHLTGLLGRHCRKAPTNTEPRTVGIGIQLDLDESWNYDFLEWESINFIERVHYASIHPTNDYGVHFCGKSVRFFVRFRYLESVTWALDELAISLGDTAVLHAQSVANAYSPINVCIWKQEWLSFKETERLASESNIIRVSDHTVAGPLRSRVGEGSERGWFGTHNYSDGKAETEFVALAVDVNTFFKAIVQESLSPVMVVNASRTVPSMRETVSIVSGESFTDREKNIVRGGRLDQSALLSTIAAQVNVGDSHWQGMCKAVSSSIGHEDDAVEYDEQSILQRINGFLQDELFIENGYQLKAEIFYVALPDEDGDLPYEYSCTYPKLVRLYLVDHHQRALLFEDVGSGIGYVLPVIASLAGDDISLIQQPELHLHPALQSKLGDVIIKAVENKSFDRAFTLIETHSEHLLLRVMRLIKTAQERSEEVLNPITYERVAILYFEPSVSGETKVRRLRLAPDGQLIDRWPGGFFKERLRDIFDE